MGNDSLDPLDDLLPATVARVREPTPVSLTVSEAAALWGVSYTVVRKWIAQKRVRAEKHGRDWWILQRERPEKLTRGGLTDEQRAAWNTGAKKDGAEEG